MVQKVVLQVQGQVFRLNNELVLRDIECASVVHEVVRHSTGQQGALRRGDMIETVLVLIRGFSVFVYGILAVCGCHCALE